MTIGKSKMASKTAREEKVEPKSTFLVAKKEQPIDGEKEESMVLDAIKVLDEDKTVIN